MGSDVLHRKKTYRNHGLEQDPRGSKQRDGPMHGFGPFEAAARFWRAFDE
jgi:transposase-like protein